MKLSPTPWSGVVLTLLIGGLAVIWFSNGKGIVREDHGRHISIPDQLLVPLQVRAAYNKDRVFFQYRWPADKPHLIHDVLRYEGGQWKTYGKAVPGSEPNGLHEDRVAMLVDDGSVPDFGRYGGYLTIGNGLAALTQQADEKAVKDHPYLGKQLKQTEVTKYLPLTRTDPSDWATTVDSDRMLTLRKGGYFLDLWHWRANRGGPIGYADDQLVSGIRDGDPGKSAWSTNWDGEKKQPKWMFDASKAGYAALKWDDVINGRISQDSKHFLHPSTAAAFDPAHQWQEGDTLPRRALRDPEGSRAGIQAENRWQDGFWTVTMSRALDTGNPEDDKIFREGSNYSLAFAIHRKATGGRWHYVSLPISMSLDHEADLKAARFDGEAPSWTQAWKDVQLFYPGQVSWPMLNSDKHAGAAKIKQGVPVKARHNEKQLSIYGVETEFSKEIINQWRLTLIVGLLLFAAAGFTIKRRLGH